MGASAPVEVGTRGTVGSLLKKEIDYFRRLEVERNFPEPSSGGGATTTSTTSSSSSWPSIRFLSLNLNLSWRRKKRRGSGGVRPGLCSIVEVADTHRLNLNEIPGFSYRNLRVDSKEFEICTEIA